NKMIEKTIREIKEAQASRERTKKARTELKKFSVSIRDKKPKRKRDKIPPPKHVVSKMPEERSKLSVGDTVTLLKHNFTGEIIEIKDTTATVLSGYVNIKIPLEQLRKAVVTDKETRKQKHRKSTYGNIISELNKKMADFKPSIDVRGKRAEEALSVIRQYIDDTILLNIKEVSILHGKGDGILRSVIRDYLSTIGDIAQFKDEHIEHGGSGITIVLFK
ncbi:MAG: Smr/MutS family protein, partial [Bacteroidetes bacterium]|nr:Smr/MutS family protein [Bacteroidota bacterium]